MSLLDIHVLGSPVLRQETTPVAKVTDDIRRLIDNMFETMYASRGIGLAAPQVGRLERVTVVDVARDKTKDSARPIALINPEIVLREGSARGEEGCLSIPEVFGDVTRATRITVRALDQDGHPFELDGADLLARCLQHEIDHLHGRLFIDHLSVLKRRSALSKWDEEKAKFPTFRRATVPAVAIADHHDDEEL